MVVDVKAAVAEARALDAEVVEKRRLEDIEWEREHKRLDAQRKELIQRYLRPAIIEDYKPWLAGWMERFIKGGGDIREVYIRSYPMPTYNFYVATRDIPEIPRFFGALQLEIIVPSGIKAPQILGHMPYGHSTLYFMEGFEIFGGDRPSIYSDIKL